MTGVYEYRYSNMHYSVTTARGLCLLAIGVDPTLRPRLHGLRSKRKSASGDDEQNAIRRDERHHETPISYRSNDAK